MPTVCAADSGAFAQRWCAGLDSEIVFSLLKNSLARARAHELTVARQEASRVRTSKLRPEHWHLFQSLPLASERRAKEDLKRPALP